ncbi:zinc finger transcriptional activator [Xanthoria parietina]
MTTPLAKNLAGSNYSPTTDFSQEPSQSHSRTYQACIPCRRRKVRCDLGPVDAPHEPPCVRCRRESKHCFFSATRRKRKIGSEDVDGYNDDLDDDFVARNSRQRTSYTTSSPDTQLLTPRSPRRPAALSTSPDSSNLNTRSLDEPKTFPYYVNSNAANQAAGQAQEVTNQTAATLFHTPINTPGDALHLLLEASGRSESLQRQTSAEQEHRHNLLSPSSHPVEKRPFARSVAPVSLRDRKENIDPEISGGQGSQHSAATPNIGDALRTWSRLRFVRAGWFTAREAIAYIDYYYEYLDPLTPISPPDFRSPTTHPRFLNEEPLLAVTVLTIASRYKQLAGAGAESRSYMIHERLWSYLQNMITRMFWGQEQFGGGFCGAGMKKLPPRSAIKGGLRTMGTIESLLLLNEFHPRSMHFPPGDDGDDILTSIEDPYLSPVQDETVGEGPSLEETTVVGWSEPALRSDRMCWSLIGMSHTLAFELGVYGDFNRGFRALRTPELSGPSFSHDEQRSDRIERLLYVFINSACGRFGFPPMYDGHDEDLGLRGVHARVMNRPYSPNATDAVQEAWTDITLIMKACNAHLFTSRDHTEALIQNGGYMTFLEQYQSLMDSFGRKLESAKLPQFALIILLIDLHYIRLYIFSLALQAVLGHWTNNVAPGTDEQMSNMAFSELYRRNEVYITEVVKAARNLLRLVVDNLLPGDYLKHAPVRTYFRILSGAMFLLKTFAIGAKEDEVSTSLQLLDRTVKALRTSVVDDVHLCLRIADLLERLTSNLRHKFVRLPARNASSTRPPDPTNTYGATPLEDPSLDTGFQQQSNMAPLSMAANPTNFLDNNISIMPPPDASYQFNPNMNLYPNNALYGNNNAVSPFQGGTTEEDWLTLDLNPLLASDSTGFQTSVGNNDGQWFGDLQINGNLEVLGKLVEGWDAPGLMGNQ